MYPCARCSLCEQTHLNLAVSNVSFEPCSHHVSLAQPQFSCAFEDLGSLCLVKQYYFQRYQDRNIRPVPKANVLDYCC